MNKLTIAYFYKDQLDLYGDNGNVEILKYRTLKRGLDVSVLDIGVGRNIDPGSLKEINLVFMGGGPDSGQRTVYKDLVESKGNFLKNYIEAGGVGLFICGAYQLLGKYYKAADGSVLEGLSIFDMYTRHFGSDKPRCIGNTVAKMSITTGELGETIVGFENHGGRTFLGQSAKPFASIIKGHGNNSEDGTEGILHKNAIGTYFHGPVLSRNPHLADFLIKKALGIDSLAKIDDSLIVSAHTASKKLK